MSVPARSVWRVLEPLRGDPGHPPLTSPLALLGWLARRQLSVMAFAIVLGILNALAAASLPYLLGTAVDEGLAAGLSRDLVVTSLLLLGVGLVMAVTDAGRHVGEVAGWVHAAFGVSRLVGHHVTRTGPAIGAELPTGEVVATVASDAYHVGNTAEALPRFAGSLVAFGVVAVVLLDRSVALGLVVLLGLPVTTAVLALVVRPLHARQAAHRAATGRLTTLGSDTVSGLRVLRGIGGEDVFSARYAEQSQRVRAAGVRVADASALLAALQVLLPGLLVAAVVWMGAHLALRGDITPGELVTFYGYTAFLTLPVQAATEFLQMFTRARVGAGRVVKVLRVTPSAADAAPAPAEPPDRRPAPEGPLVDLRTGVRVEPGRSTAVVSSDPDAAAALAARLGRLRDDDAAVTWGGIPLRELPLALVREHVVVSPATPQLFSGTLRHELDVRDRADDAALHTALRTADAGDVLTSMPAGLDGEITEKGRSLSGGQRQRVALARALLTEAPTLVLVEPTSAVDAHTESRIAEGLARHRRGRTTVVVTVSPLVLEHVDEVVLLEDGAERTRGTHRDLLRRAADGDPDARAYQRVVSRSTGDDDAATGDDDASDAVPARTREEAR